MLKHELQGINSRSLDAERWFCIPHSHYTVIADCCKPIGLLVEIARDYAETSRVEWYRHRALTECSESELVAKE